MSRKSSRSHGRHGVVRRSSPALPRLDHLLQVLQDLSPGEVVEARELALVVVPGLAEVQRGGPTVTPGHEARCGAAALGDLEDDVRSRPRRCGAAPGMGADALPFDPTTRYRLDHPQPHHPVVRARIVLQHQATSRFNRRLLGPPGSYRLGPGDCGVDLLNGRIDRKLVTDGRHRRPYEFPISMT